MSEWEKYHINVPVSRIKRLLRLICGYTLLVLGIIGLFLPILQGTLMILAGAALLGWDLSFLKRGRDRLVSWLRGR
ncbi:MAG: PGPGW domain-containing protein [bacterium]